MLAGTRGEETILAGAKRNGSHSGVIQKTVDFRVSCLAPWRPIHTKEMTRKFVLRVKYHSNPVTKIHLPYQISVFDPSLLCPLAIGASDI